MEEMLKGYQWMENKTFGCVYYFPNNKDKEAIHLPPNTTLKEPPSDIPAGQEAFWTGSDWALRTIAP